MFQPGSAHRDCKRVMGNEIEDKLKYLMAVVFEVSIDEITDETSPDTLEQWDSFKHMNLVIALEETFGIEFDELQIPNLTHYQIILHAVSAILDHS